MLLAPYDVTMRPGMGFNTATQDACEYDAVLTNTPILGGNETQQTRSAGCRNVAHTGCFVNQMSEVMERLNIGAPLLVKQLATGGETPSSLFFHTKTFLESDINYMVQVKVVCRQVMFNDLTVFSPAEGASPADWGRLYGDAFVSGFTEGGELAAVVSIRLQDRSKEGEVRRLLAAHLNLQNAQQATSGDVSAATSWGAVQEIIVAVSCRGAGGIEDRLATDWTLETLKSAIAAFPKDVVSSPVRLDTILTKYTSLPSFREKLSKGDVSVDASDANKARTYMYKLLNDYLKYKAIGCDLQTTMDKVASGISELVARPEVPGTSQLSAADMSQYDEAAKRTSFSSTEALTPYKPDIFGLDKAGRDCALEMTQIEKEICSDRKILSDPLRKLQYLHPTIFRMLIPDARPAEEQQKIRKLREEKTKLEEELRLASAKMKELEGHNYTPFALNTPIRIRNKASSKSIHLEWDNGSGNKAVRQNDSIASDLNQQFQIKKAGVTGYLFQHVASGLFLAVGEPGTDNRIYLTAHRLGAAFIFEQAQNGICYIRYAEQPEYTFNMDGDQGMNVRIIIWPSRPVDKTDRDRWYVKAWNDVSL